jgi:hypothetical protein
MSAAFPFRDAYAACPQNLCDCLGAATAFTVVGANDLLLRQGFVNSYGYPEISGTGIHGDVCGPKALASGQPSSGQRTDMDNLSVLAGPGELAARFVTYDPQGIGTPGVRVPGVVATGGGSLDGAVTAGSIDTTGTHPSIAACQQAVSDIQTASANLAALAPTQTLGKVVLRGETLDLYVGPGVQVINAESITMRPKRLYAGGFPHFAEIMVHPQAGTEAVIINTGKLSMGGDCAFYYSGSPKKMIVNVPGPGRTVKIALYNSIDVPILAPERTVKVGVAVIANIYAGKVMLRGSELYDVVGAPCTATTSTTSTSSTTTTSAP